jgi:chromosome segregation ATPase
MAFTTLKGKTPETARVDGAIEYVRKMHERITERLEKIEADISSIEDRFERSQLVIHSLNKDVKALESIPPPVIPMVPDISPLRNKLAALDNEMASSLSAYKKLVQRVDEIKIPEMPVMPEIPKAPSLVPIYLWLGVISTVLIWVLI